MKKQAPLCVAVIALLMIYAGGGLLDTCGTIEFDVDSGFDNDYDIDDFYEVIYQGYEEMSSPRRLLIR